MNQGGTGLSNVGSNGSFLTVANGALAYSSLNSLLTQGAITGNILPNMGGATGNVSNVVLGDPNNRFKDIYADELHLGADSLYVNGKEVISDVSDVMNFTTDPDQSLKLKTTGTGNLFLNTDQGTLFLNANNQLSATGKGGIVLTVPSDNASENLNITNNSLNGNITLNATGANSQILDSALQKISLTAPLLELNGNVTSSGTINASNISGTNTGDETQTTIKNKLGIASSTSSGYLTSADWNTFNNKQPAGNYQPAGSYALQTTTINGHDLSNSISLTQPILARK